MLKKSTTLLILLCTLSLLLVACGSGNNQTATQEESGNTIHMNNTDFEQTIIEIKKGESITLVSDTLVPHIMSNGSWNDGVPQPGAEPGAPTVEGMEIPGNNSGSIGPFTTAGTFQLYCTIHPNMDLTVIVK